MVGWVSQWYGCVCVRTHEFVKAVYIRACSEASLI